MALCVHREPKFKAFKRASPDARFRYAATKYLVGSGAGNFELFDFLEILPHVNACLNAFAAILLVVGLWLIKQKKETAHKWTMLACFGVSIVFLVCYLTYHQLLHQTTGSHGRSFDHPNAAVLWGYRLMLISHVLLAATVPFLAVATIYFGLRDDRPRHRKLAKWTFPIWLYVSVTGVLVYLMLYQLFSRGA